MWATPTPPGGGKHPLKTRSGAFFTPRQGECNSPSLKTPKGVLPDSTPTGEQAPPAKAAPPTFCL